MSSVRTRGRVMGAHESYIAALWPAMHTIRNVQEADSDFRPKTRGHSSM